MISPTSFLPWFVGGKIPFHQIRAVVKTPGLGWWYGPASWGRVGQLGQTWCMELAHQIWACVDPLVRPGLRGYVDTPVGLLRLGGRRSVITLVSSPWRFCVSDTPWLRHLVVARTGTLWPNGTSHTPDSRLHPWRDINTFFAATQGFLHA